VLSTLHMAVGLRNLKTMSSNRNRGAPNHRGDSNHRNPGANWFDEATTDDEVQRTTEAMRQLGNRRVRTLAIEKDDAATSEVESGHESNTSGVPDRKSRTKKRHLTNSGEKPASKESRGDGPRDRSEARYISRYRADGSLIPPSAAQANATRMAAEDKASRYRDDANTGLRRPRPRGSGLGGGDIGFNRGNTSSRGRGRGGRQFTGNGNGQNGNNFNNFNDKNAAGTAAQSKNKNWPSMAVKNMNQSAGSPATANRDPTNQNPNINESEINSYLDRSNESLASSDPSYAKSQNPTYAAQTAKQLEAAERVLMVHSGTEETLELTETQFNAIMGEIEKQAFIAAVKKMPVPKIKWCKFSQFGDKGFIGVQDDTNAELVINAIARICIGGIGFRAWCIEDLEPKNLVSIHISKFQSGLGAPLIMEGIMAANTLKGAANRAWIVLDGGWDYVTRAPYDTLKFFADKTLFDDLLLRLSGDRGRRIYLTVGTGERQVFLSEQPGVAASRARDRAELAQIRAAAAKVVADAIVKVAADTL
jgi:hypothetical protein